MPVAAGIVTLPFLSIIQSSGHNKLLVSAVVADILVFKHQDNHSQNTDAIPIALDQDYELYGFQSEST